MSLNIPVLGTFRWVFPNDPAIDAERWENPQAMGHDYEPPPLKEGETAAFLELRQLSNAAYARARAIQAQADGILPPDMEEHILRHGIVGWGGLSRGGEPLPPPALEDGPYGQRLTRDSYEAILPFLSEFAPVLATHLYLLSLPRIS